VLVVPRFHHVNLGVPLGGIAAESTFLIDVLGYRAAPIPESMLGGDLYWFDADDGSQVHLSEDEAHHPAARAHVALHYGDGLSEIEHRLQARGVKSHGDDSPQGLRVVFCRDPAGNLWELRGRPRPPVG
jgi:catechol 2,3-dioxygenase-like lactoylglutathione lyase family enzyme